MKNVGTSIGKTAENKKLGINDTETTNEVLYTL